jgi:hypothetical protein
MSTFSAQPIVIDGKGHLLGRLASIISKQVSLDSGFSGITCLERKERNWIEEQSAEIVKMMPREEGGMLLVPYKSGTPKAAAQDSQLVPDRDYGDGETERRTGLGLSKFQNTDANFPAPHGPEGHCCTMRGDQHLRLVLPKQAKVPRIPPQYVFS